MDQEQGVAEHDQEDRKDVDHSDPRLDEEQAIEARQGGGREGEDAVLPQLSRQQVHQRHAERAEYAAHDAPAKGVEAQICVVALCALEGRPPPSVQPLAGGDDQLREGWFGIKVDGALEVVMGEDTEPDLVEDLALRWLWPLPRLWVAALVGIREAAESACLVLDVDRRVVHTVADEAASGQKVRHDRAEETKDESDQQQRTHQDQVHPIQPKPPEKPGLRRLSDWLSPGGGFGRRPRGGGDRHLPRLGRRRLPPRFTPVFNGSREVISQAIASGSGIGSATVSSRTSCAPSLRRSCASAASSPRTRMNSAGLSISGLVGCLIYRFLPPSKWRPRGCTRALRIRS